MLQTLPGGLDVSSGQKVQEFWRQDRKLHINVKELQAAVNTLKSLAKKGEHVVLLVDNAVAYYYLKKGGGRLPHLNVLMRDLWAWCMQRRISVDVNWVPSDEQRADFLSRTPLDRGDYTLNPEIFRDMVHFQGGIARDGHVRLTGEQKIGKICFKGSSLGELQGRRPKVSFGGYKYMLCQPPLENNFALAEEGAGAPRSTMHVDSPLLGFSHMVAPLGKVASTWDQGAGDPPCPGMFWNCLGELMPSPRWHLLCVIISGSAYKGRKSHLDQLIFI